MERKYYLGPASWPQWVLALLPFAKKFGIGEKSPAKIHDDEYYKGGIEQDKIKTDTKFSKGMLKLCGYNPFAYICACIYYNLVDWFGFMYYNYKK